MNRTENLIKILPCWIDSSKLINDIVLVDWSSKKPLIEYQDIKQLMIYKKLKLIEVVDEQTFSLPRSYNLAFNKTNSKNKYLIKIDSDYLLKDHTFIEDKIQFLNNTFIRGAAKSHYTGFLAIEKHRFLYYNENFYGWGYDDLDLYSRLQKNNLKQTIFTNIEKYIYHIPHSDNDSVANYSIKNKATSEKNNRLLSTEPFTISQYETIEKTDNYEKVKRVC